MSRKYAEKELLIFYGFKKIITDNSNIENIKVSDIAKAAGIGKGTIYEYFKSKDEIIARSIIYNFKIDIINTIEAIKEVSTFKEQCNHLFHYSISSGKFIFPSLRILYNQVVPKELNNILLEDFEEILELKTQLYNLLDYVINTGIDENIINKDLSRDYQRYVLISSSMGIINKINANHFRQINLSDDESINTQKNFAYTMILKSLA
ncbi:MAG: TetR/AcrR family transcriptional regulator [Terrisporobacter othiniensis]|uniref:TetR/AcrR family transcriptional regulator n=1 Tax=Terrisporobacter petrolearius TaxID=1460447 RepID=UPI0022E23761|nr:TetR/AcrR family transcriptional regulator [Terrisporobacter petrolearius]MDU4862003.1 TetR/AcrR family transcriptional regulator [Terrisporobacter othiniensis]MDU6995639.1 TetR/AcrR family transcriptional regulator [Terrisporobacter othiniensis]